ncbi:MAG: polyprenyl synthetase family protein [Candidatus Portiera sp.]|nr:polyprenyl synthetase family protein [Portiera sp.]
MLPSSAVAEDLCRYKQEFAKHLGDHNNIADMLSFLQENEGKAIRPQLLLTLCSLFECREEDRFKIAVATEYIHTASLIHDDIIDAAISRRNQETLHKKWGIKNAILIGDFLYSRAFELVCQTKYSEVLGLFAKAANRLSISEINQLDIKDDAVASTIENEETCLNLAKEKTGVLFAVVCEASVVVSSEQLHRHHKDIAKHRTVAFNYGMNLGMAFQLMDDHLDYSATSSKWGKQRLQDLSEAKVTLPLVYLYQSSSDLDKKQIIDVLQQKIPSPQAIQTIDTKMQSSSSLAKVEKTIKFFSDKALANLETLAPGPVTEESESLRNLALAASRRNH